MKTIVIFITTLFCVTSIFAQTNYYPATKTFYEDGYTYQCDVDASRSVKLYNKTNQWTYVKQVDKSTGELYIIDDSTPDVIEYDTWVNPKCDSIVNNAFSAAEKRRVNGDDFTIVMSINSDTGKVIEIYFRFANFNPYATIPISVYRKIETDMKKYIWFTPTKEGKKLNHILYWRGVAPK